jgi:nicotinamidase-related amidase
MHLRRSARRGSTRSTDGGRNGRPRRRMARLVVEQDLTAAVLATKGERRVSTVLLVVDVQQDYFPGGRMPLVDPEAAAANVRALLDRFRAEGWPVAHVWHQAVKPDATFLVAGTDGCAPWPTVAPAAGEAVFIKRYPNAFRETALASWLREQAADRLLVTGMMTHMCVDATVRAAADLGWSVDVASDACATRDVVHAGTTVPAALVHAAFLAALDGTYATVRPTTEWLRT